LKSSTWNCSRDLHSGSDIWYKRAVQQHQVWKLLATVTL